MTTREQLRGIAPALTSYLDGIAESSKLQRKATERLLEASDAAYVAYAEEVCGRVTAGLLGGRVEEGVGAYLSLCTEINREQFYFKKSGAYRVTSAADAERDVYSNVTRMRTYIIGLLLSYLFWPNHYRMIRFLRDELHGGGPIDAACEVGVGHGLLAREVRQAAPDCVLTLIDVSAASLQVAGGVLSALGVDTGSSRLQMKQADFLDETSSLGPFDLMVLGEILEHVDEPARFLEQARRALAPGGRVYISTCANCPAPDHVYLFKSVEEIQELLVRSGFKVDKELILPVEDVPRAEWERRRVTINYAAMLSK